MCVVALALCLIVQGQGLCPRAPGGRGVCRGRVRPCADPGRTPALETVRRCGQGQCALAAARASAGGRVPRMGMQCVVYVLSVCEACGRVVCARPETHC